MATITIDHLKGIYNRYIHAIGGRHATSWNDVGGYKLDYASLYGGYVITRIENKMGGISYPFFYNRLTKKELYNAMCFACLTLEHIKNEKRLKDENDKRLQDENH